MPHHLPLSWPTPDSGHLPSWQLLPLMTNLFPGMSVEEVLSSQVANLARLQLERMVEHRVYTSTPQDILGYVSTGGPTGPELGDSWGSRHPLAFSGHHPVLERWGESERLTQRSDNSLWQAAQGSGTEGPGPDPLLEAGATFTGDPQGDGGPSPVPAGKARRPRGRGAGSWEEGTCTPRQGRVSWRCREDCTPSQG